MINKGKARSDAGQLAAYLLQPRNAEVLMVHGTAALDLTAALLEMEERRELTNSRYSVYHAQMNWYADEELRPEDQLKAVQILEDRLGFTGQPRAVVRHNDKGREHLHVVWSLVDVENERAVRYSHNYRKHEEAAREIEQRFELRRVQGAHIDREGKPRPERTPDQWEYQQAKRLQGQDPRAWRQSVRDDWKRSDNGASFKTAIEEDRCLMANGDKRDCFVIVNEHGAILALNTKTVGARAAEIRAKLADIDRSQLPSVDEAKQLQHDRQQEKSNGRGNTGRGVYDVLRDESARVAEAFYFDRDRQAREWEAGLHEAAIAFDESRPREKKPTLFPSRKFTDREIWQQEREAKRQAWIAARSAERVANAPENGTTAAALRHAIQTTENPQQLADVLQERGLRLAQVTREDTDQPWPKRYGELELYAQPKAKDDRPAWQQPREGELVAVNQSGHVYRFTERNSGKTRQQLDDYLGNIERANLPNVAAAKEAAQAEQEQARAAWIEARCVERIEQRAAQIAHYETVQQIGQAYAETQTGPELFAALEQRGLKTGRASEDDAMRAAVQRSYGLRAQSFEAGDYVVMNDHGQVYKLDATTIHDDENKIIARLAEIDGGNMLNVRGLRALHETRPIANESDHFIAALNTIDTGLRRGARFADKTLDLSAEALDMAGSAARVAMQFIEGIMEGPSHAISGGTEQQKRQANAIAAAREQAKAKRTPPAEQPRQPANEQAPAAKAPQVQERDTLSEALQRLRDSKRAEPANDADEEKKKRDRHRGRDRDR